MSDSRKVLEELDRPVVEAFAKAGLDTSMVAPASLPLLDLDPGPSWLARRHSAVGVLVTDRRAQAAKVLPAEVPTIVGAVGAVVIEGTGVGCEGTLLLRLDPKAIDGVSRRTLRVFRWDDKSATWILLRYSGPGSDGSYVWARVASPGRYCIVGMASDPVMLQVLSVAGAASALLAALPSSDAAATLLQSVVASILASVGDWPEKRRPRIVADLLGEAAGADLPVGYGFTQGRDWKMLNQVAHGDNSIAIVSPGLTTYAADRLERLAVTSNWVSVGPSNFSGCILQVALRTDGEEGLYLCAAGGGAWRLEGFVTGSIPPYRWIPFRDQSRLLLSAAIATAPSDGDVVYLADNSGMIYRSADAGQNWVPGTGPRRGCQSAAGRSGEQRPCALRDSNRALPVVRRCTVMDGAAQRGGARSHPGPRRPCRHLHRSPPQRSFQDQQRRTVMAERSSLVEGAARPLGSMIRLAVGGGPGGARARAGQVKLDAGALHETLGAETAAEQRGRHWARVVARVAPMVITTGATS